MWTPWYPSQRLKYWTRIVIQNRLLSGTSIRQQIQKSPSFLCRKQFRQKEDWVAIPLIQWQGCGVQPLPKTPNSRRQGIKKNMLPLAEENGREAWDATILWHWTYLTTTFPDSNKLIMADRDSSPVDFYESPLFKGLFMPRPLVRGLLPKRSTW